jgi:hypothetical protein
VPTQTVNFDRGQYQYIVATSEEGEFSDRVRELLDKGIDAEETDG